MAHVSFGMTFIFSLFFSGTHARSYLSGTAIFFPHGTHLPPHASPHTHHFAPALRGPATSLQEATTAAQSWVAQPKMDGGAEPGRGMQREEDE